MTIGFSAAVLLTSCGTVTRADGTEVPLWEEVLNVGGSTALESAPTNPADLNGWIYAGLAGAAGAIGVAARAYQKRKKKA